MHQIGTLAVLLVLVFWGNPPQEQSQASTPDSPVQKLDLKAGMHPPKAIFQPQAEYSPEARKKLIDGKCLISMIVDARGLPQDVHVVRCSDSVFAQPSLASTSKYRFLPATTSAGEPVAVIIYVEVDFRIDGAREIVDPVRYAMASPPDVTSPAPDAKGVYPLTKTMTIPAIARFNDKGYGTMAFTMEGKSPCDIALTIDAKGRPSDPAVVHCEHDGLEGPATKSLMASRYKPGLLNGNPVPIRVLLHIEYGDFPVSN